MAVIVFFLLFHVIASFDVSKTKYCKVYNKLPLPAIRSLPQPDERSGIGQIFKHLHSSKSIHFQQSETLNCYHWKCKSSVFAGSNCSYCLPSVFVAGFSKCGTTALCSKLLLHPSIKPYRKKEINIFTKYFDKFTWTKFEKRVLDTNPQNTGNLYLDCTASAFRDFNALVYLMKYSSSTKFIFVVRDPYQRLASWLLMFKRALPPARYERFYRVWMSALRKSQYHSSSRYNDTVIANLMTQERYISSFLYAEVLLHWMTGIPQNQILILDHYDLEENPLKIMRTIERYLSIPSHSYDMSELLSLSVNTGVIPKDDDGHLTGGQSQSQSQLSEEEEEEDETRRRLRILSEGNVSRTHPIHPPYRITDDKLLQLSRKLFRPSLCLFERLFGWSIRMTTESEL